MYSVDRGASLHMTGEGGSSLSLQQEKKTIRHTKKRPEDPNRDWHRPFQQKKRVRIYIEDVGTHTCTREVGGGSALRIVSLGRTVR